MLGMCLLDKRILVGYTGELIYHEAGVSAKFCAGVPAKCSFMQYVLSVMSNDHPGIVAGVSSAVENLGGNIDSCSQTVLGGYFTFIVIMTLPTEYPSQELADKIRNSEGLGPDYQIIARRIDSEPKKGPDSSCHPVGGDIFVITAFGKDRPGIVREFSRYLAGHDININDLYGDKTGEEFVLIGQLRIPANVNIRNLQDDLVEMGRELGFTVKLQHSNIFIATNRIRLE